VFAVEVRDHIMIAHSFRGAIFGPVLGPLNYRNLDTVADFKELNTTTEFLTRHIYDRLADAARSGKLGRDGRGLKAIRVTISESHVARAWYEADLW
jgi:hypothetical protein